MGVQTRSQKKKLMKIKKTHTERFKRTLAYRGPKRWNGLPYQLHYMESRSSFNTGLRSHLAEREKKRVETLE